MVVPMRLEKMTRPFVLAAWPAEGSVTAEVVDMISLSHAGPRIDFGPGFEYKPSYVRPVHATDKLSI
ncbi:hypothetical protein GCM10027449_12290 [Sinomonas notoginsengisoli]